MDDVRFESAGERCAAWHLTGEGDAFAPDGRRPCVVMAHGFGGTRDSGLLPFAQAFAAAGLDALVFDYRNFGDSTGEPRQLVDWRRHREDYRAAIAHARGLDGVDPDRIVLWGTSYSGGHVVAVAADDAASPRSIAQTPATDGLAALLELAKYAGPLPPLRMAAIGVRDLVGGLLGREPIRLPLVGPPGTLAAMASPDAEPGFLAVAGPTFENAFCARGCSTSAQPAGDPRGRPALPDAVPDRRPRRHLSAGGGGEGGMGSHGPGGGAPLPHRALRHLRGRGARAVDRRPAPLPAPAPRGARARSGLANPQPPSTGSDP